MSSQIVYLLLCVMCAKIAVAQDYVRSERSTASSSSGSYSGSSSGSGSQGGGGGGNFMFPQGNQFYNPYPNFGGFPFQDFNALYQQFLASLNAAQAYAAQNPHYAAIFNQQIASLMAQQQAAMAQNPLAFPTVDSNTIPPDVRTSGASPVYASSSINYGPKGGYGQAATYPGGPDGLGVRIAEEFPSPTGGSFGVFSSSSSGTSDVNGKRTSFKSSTFGTNDNGKITFRTVNE